MSNKPQKEYLKAKIMTAGPEQLQTMLYDGAVRFCEQGRQAIQDKDIPTTHDRLMRAQRIVLELSSGLKTEVNPELCGKLASLYNYVYRLLVDANLKRDLQKLDEALDLLRYQRETWSMALEKLRQEKMKQAEPADRGPRKIESDRPSDSTAGKPAGNEHLVGGTLSIEG